MEIGTDGAGTALEGQACQDRLVVNIMDPGSKIIVEHHCRQGWLDMAPALHCRQAYGSTIRLSTPVITISPVSKGFTWRDALVNAYTWYKQLDSMMYIMPSHVHIRCRCKEFSRLCE